MDANVWLRGRNLDPRDTCQTTLFSVCDEKLYKSTQLLAPKLQIFETPASVMSTQLVLASQVPTD